MTNEKEVLELAKKHGAEFAKTFDGEALVQFTGAQLEECIAAIAQKMISEGWRQCAKGQGETQYCESAKLNRDDYTVGYMGAMLDEARRALSFTQQSSEAFLAEVRAKALEDVVTAYILQPVGFERMSLQEMIESKVAELRKPEWKKRGQTTCMKCDFEESDGSLIEQCAKCKAADAQPEGKDGK